MPKANIAPTTRCDFHYPIIILTNAIKIYFSLYRAAAADQTSPRRAHASYPRVSLRELNKRLFKITLFFEVYDRFRVVVRIDILGILFGILFEAGVFGTLILFAFEQSPKSSATFSGAVLYTLLRLQ